MSESIKIKIAAKEFTVRRLTLRQSRAIGLCVDRTIPEDAKFTFAVDQAIAVVSAALSRDYPDMNMDAIMDAEVSAKEFVAISTAILEFSGFIKVKADTSGEVSPGAA